MVQPSNQLLSAVLSTKAWIIPAEQIKWNINNRFTDIIYKWSDDTQHNINIHEFAQMAKQWAANHSYQIYSKSTRSIGVAKIRKLKPGAKRRNLILCEIKPTEVEAIIAAAEWVLQEINKCN